MQSTRAGIPDLNAVTGSETDRQYDGWQKKKQAGTCFFLGKIKSDILQRTQLVETVTLVLQFS